MEKKGTEAPPVAQAKPAQGGAVAALARDTAYDINNLAGVVLGSTAELRRMCNGRDDLAVHLARIEDAAEKVSHLAERQLNIIEGKVRPPRPVNVNALVSHALQFEEQASDGKFSVKRYLDPDLWPISADPNQLTTVLLQIALNAYEAAGPTGTVSLRTQNIALDGESARPLYLQPGQYVLLSIQDSGPGIPPDVVEHIFQSGETTKGAGRGQGLKIAYRIVKDHKGHIALRSEPGIGTSVDIYWPASAEPGSERESAPGVVLQGNETVLVIDDEPMMVEVICRSLSSLGYTAISASNGREAVELATSYDGDIHLALLDMAMPIMGGAETYPLLRNIRPGIKIIIMSGYDLGTLGSALADAGVSGVLQKPFRVERLADAIRAALTSDVEKPLKAVISTS